MKTPNEETLNIESIAKQIFQDIYQQATVVKHCTKCHSDQISLINADSCMYKCHTCNYTFSPKINSLYQKLRLNDEKIIRMLIAMISDYTLEETVKFTQSNAESVKRRWALLFENVNWNQYNLLIREQPTKNIYADFDIILN